MKKQFTDKDRDALKKNLEKFEQKGTVIVYGFAVKDSGSGVFSNERLILLNSAQKSIRYYSKQPPGLLFTKLQQIPEGKTKLVYDKEHFKCEAVKGKTSTMKIEWEVNKKLENWTFTFARATMMNEFVAAVEAAIAGTINKDPTFVNAPNNQTQASNPPANNTSPSNVPANNLEKNNIPPSVNNNQEVKPTGSTITQPAKQQPAASTVTQKNQPMKTQPTTSTVPQKNEAVKPTEATKTEPVRPELLNQPAQKPTYSSVKPVSPPKQTQKMNSVPTSSNPPSNSNFILDPPTNPNAANSTYNHSNNQPQSQPQYQSQYQPQPQYQYQSQTQAQPQPQYNDVSEQLRALKEKDPKRFNLTNQLSRKDLHQNPNDNLVMDNPKDNVQTKRQSEYGQNKPTQSAFSRTKQPQPQYTSMKGSNSNNNLSYPQPSDNQIRNNSEKPTSGYQQQSIRKNPTNRQLLSKNPSVGDYGSQNQPMNRTQSQAPIYSTQKQNQSRIKSEYGYDTNEQKKPPAKIVESKKWNQMWCTTNNPLEIYEEFILECNRISKEIIDELPCLKSQRQYNPIKNDGPYYLYNLGGITYNMHYFGDDASLQDSDREQDERAPLIFDHESYTEAKREFYNYNYVLAVTGNKGPIKVPLSCYIQFKGVLIFCRANMPDFFQRVSPHQFEKQLENLQQALHIRFVFNSMSLFAHPQKKYFLLADLDELIPRTPQATHPPAYFRKQFLLQNTYMIDDQSSVNKIFNKLVNENVKQFLARFETFESWVINSNDLVKQVHQSGINMACLPLIHEETNLPFLKRVITSQMTKNVFCDILRSELNSVYASIPMNDVDELTPQHIEKMVIDCTHVLLNQLFSYGSSSENIWRLVVKQVNKRFKIVVSKEDILPGYLLGGIMGTIGINCDYKTPDLNRKESFFIRQNTIPRDLLIDFYSKVRRYDLDSVSPLIARIQDILTSQPNPDNFQQLVRSLQLKTKPIPPFCEPIKPEITTYLCNFIPLGDHDQFDHVGIYQMLEAEPHTYCSMKISLLGIKWAAKNKNDILANKLFEIKSEQNSFWVSEFNPAISQFYDFFSLYNVSIGNYDEAVKLAKSSLINSIKLTGPNSLPVADKHYQLGNIFFKIGRKEESLKQYLKTKQILEQHKQTAIPEYGVILLKLSLLYLNFGKISDCVGSSLEALKIFDTNGGNQQQQIETFQILARSYEITRKTGDLVSVGALCGQKFNNTENPKIFERMMKIVLLPKLTTISHEDAKILLKVVSKLEQLESPITYIDAFNYLHLRAQSEVIMKRLFVFIDNVSNLYEDVMRKDLFRRHKSLYNQVKSEAADMLVLLQAVLVMTGYNFVNGSLKQNYY